MKGCPFKGCPKKFRSSKAFKKHYSSAHTKGATWDKP